MARSRSGGVSIAMCPAATPFSDVGVKQIEFREIPKRKQARFFPSTFVNIRIYTPILKSYGDDDLREIVWLR